MDALKKTERLVENLAASWTEAVLETLNAAGLRRISVERELETWRTLTSVLRSELRWQRVFRSSMLVSVNEFMERVLWKAALWVAKKLSPQAGSPEFVRRLRQLAAARRATWVERHLFSEILRQPSVPAAFKSPGSTDFVPRLNLAVAGTPEPSSCV